MLDVVDMLMADEGPLTAADIDAPTPDESPLPAVQTYMVDGDEDGWDGSFVADVAFFATTYTEASRLARKFHDRFVGYSHRVESNGSAVRLDSVGTVSLPNEVAWLDDRSIRRFVATYAVTYRR